jgi:predicted metalloprotease
MTAAHEMGHAAQIRFIWDGEQEATLDETTVLRETQADCMAGVTIATSEKNGSLTMDAGDEQEIRDVMKAIGDYGNDHGTPQERYDAYERGYQTADIEACLGNKPGSGE